MFSFSIQIIM